jgi:hypothetical protein
MITRSQKNQQLLYSPIPNIQELKLISDLILENPVKEKFIQNIQMIGSNIGDSLSWNTKELKDEINFVIDRILNSNFKWEEMYNFFLNKNITRKFVIFIIPTNIYYVKTYQFCSSYVRYVFFNTYINSLRGNPLHFLNSLSFPSPESSIQGQIFEMIVLFF